MGKISNYCKSEHCHWADHLKPLGGIMTLPINFNGKLYNMRVNERGGGTVIERFRLETGAVRVVTIEFTHFGNTFPPAAIEFLAL